jgi:hypothetical protein
MKILAIKDALNLAQMTEKLVGKNGHRLVRLNRPAIFADRVSSEYKAKPIASNGSPAVPADRPPRQEGLEAGEKLKSDSTPLTRLGS